MKIDSAYYTKRKDIMIIQFPLDRYTPDDMSGMIEEIKKVFPNNDIMCIPEDITISLIREENPFL